MTPYLFIFLLFSFLSCSETFIRGKTVRNIFHLLVFFALYFFVSGSIARGDYTSYISIFRNIDLNNIAPVFEPTFYYLLVLIKYIGLNEHYLFIVSSSLAFLIKFIYLNKYSKNYEDVNFSFYFLIYISLYAVYLELGSIRFAIATSFFLLATLYLGKDIKKYLLCIFLGSLFHTSLLIAILIPFTIRRNPLIILIFLGVLGIGLTIILSNSHVIGFFNKYYYTSKFLNYTRFGSISINFQFIKKIFLLVIFYFIFNKEIKMRKGYVYISWFISLWGIGLYFLFNINHLVASRYLLMFGVVDVLMIIFIVEKIKFQSRVIIGVPLLIIFLLFNFMLTIERNSNIFNPYTPYKNYFIGDEQLLDPEILNTDE